ncbi:MAG TPA: hypothetical protein VIN08_01820 [Ohtaekwangia sp.]|uniref:hypothetical protein n=1 Tax=Ohtaekwangia sp. TaxID=2066019 RepID=UPI002F958955
MRKLFLIALLFCPMFQGMAQVISRPQFKDKENLFFRDYIYTELVKRKALLSTLCERVTGSIQVIVAKNGDVKSISVTGEMSDTLRQTLKEIAFSSKKMWTPMEINHKKADSYPLVLLMSLHLGEGCNNSREIMLKVVRSDFSKIFLGENSNDDVVPCFILPPINFIWDYVPVDIGFEKK